MAPYIAALLILIVAILFAVYKRVDYFEVVVTTLKSTDTIGKLVTFIKKQLATNQSIQSRLEASPNFKETATEAILKQLEIMPTTEGQTVAEKLKLEAKQFKETFEEVVKTFEKLNPSMKIKELSDKAEDTTQFLAALDKIESVLKTRESYLNSKLGTASVAGVKAEDLYDAVGGTSEAVKASSVEDTKLETSGMAPSQSPVQTKEMEERIAKSVATQLKDTLLSQRSTQNMAEEGCPYAAYDSTSTAQGKEYREVKPVQTAPDMSEYIRKDSIPCWNCSLP